VSQKQKQKYRSVKDVFVRLLKLTYRATPHGRTLSADVPRVLFHYHIITGTRCNDEHSLNCSLITDVGCCSYLSADIVGRQNDDRHCVFVADGVRRHQQKINSQKNRPIRYYIMCHP